MKMDPYLRGRQQIFVALSGILAAKILPTLPLRLSGLHEMALNHSPFNYLLKKSK